MNDDDQDEDRDAVEGAADAGDEEAGAQKVAAETPRRRARKKKAKRKKATRDREEAAEAKAEADAPEPAPAAPEKGGGARGIGLAVVALVIGVTVGWFVRDARAEPKAAAEPVAAPSASAAAAASAGPCGAWETQMCAGAGQQSATCMQAKMAAEVMPSEACDTAIPLVERTLADAKAKRSSCDQVVKKLCADLGQGNPACKMVTQRTESIPVSKCEEILANYDQVLASLKNAPPMGMRPGMGAPPGMAPPGAPPGAPPAPPGH